jgi:translocation protein SEC62
VTKDVYQVFAEKVSFETEDIANILLEKNLLVCCDRVVKTLRPGKKKLSTWPTHLEIFPVSNFSCCNHCVAK